ncbi:MAG: cation:proton antiporter [Burkholderiales bacterium]|nr:cation:proton antiporter [Burkholderiales bacterium]
MHLLYILLVLLLVTRICGELAERLRQPALVGELIAGIALGMLANRYSGTFPVLADLPDNEVFKAITDLAIFFLMLLAGIELHPRELVQASGRALGVAAGGMLLPLALGYGLAWAFLPDSPLKFGQSLFLGTALAITAVPVSIKVLMDLGELKTKLGQTVVSAAVFDDVLSLMLLAVLTAVIKTGGLPDAASVVSLVGKVILYFLIAGVFGRYVFPWIGRRLKFAQAQEFQFSALLVAALAYALLAEELGMHFMLGAFLAGLFFVHRTIEPKVFDKIQSSLTSLTMGLFGPLFFASIGLHLDTAAAAEIPLFVGILVLAAFFGKLLGAGLPAYAMGFSPRDALGVGTAMSARGAVELIIANVALQAGLFLQPDPPPPIVANLFSAVVIMALATTVVTPLVMRSLLGAKSK